MSQPGWHPDPEGSGQLRWWDGQQWTSATQMRQQAPTPSSTPTSDPKPAGRKFSTVQLAGIVVGALVVIVGGAWAYQYFTQPAACKEYCSVAADLSDQKCTTPDVASCDATILEKGRVATAARDLAVTEATMSAKVELLYSGAGLVESGVGRWQSNDCAEPQEGDDLFRCRTLASDVDEAFDRFEERLAELPG